ncbi:hypothetical protein OBBRIDRAFT_864207 [Obba rivulosa]|uniref:Prolyl 4-hydroxylase alpha subunit Fe(2+) 2OG dioxygenase domain-containing protein n=1 Tax=Obba rivulosa TaxID=1052685 RepID=A0A8E2DLQ4_9APHY|nr:hypothetical protein OBBRIDRAFT_864207 [Obba rivulosa]
MFGSPVVVFPTVHDGGTLILRHKSKEWTFDTCKLLTHMPASSIAYVAFYSDVEHEVLPVKSGYRVTLTYNLYFADATECGPVTPSPTEDTFMQAFRTLLDASTFLPQGSYLGFGLRHQYPVDTLIPEGQYGTAGLQSVLDYLKGTDAVVLKVCGDLNLKASCATVYRDEEYGCDGPAHVMCSEIADLEQNNGSKNRFTSKLLTRAAGQWSGKIAKPDVKIHWVTKTPEVNLMKGIYIAYGNESALAYAYFHMCLLVKVGHAGMRETTGPMAAPTRFLSTQASSESEDEDNVDDSGDSAEVARLLW